MRRSLGFADPKLAPGHARPAMGRSDQDTSRISTVPNGRSRAGGRALRTASMLTVLLLAVTEKGRAQTAPADSSGIAGPAIAIPTYAPKVGGYAIVRERWMEHAGLTATLHRIRTSFEGALPNAFSYRLLIEYQAAVGPRTAAAVSLRDAYMKWTRGAASVSAGQFKTPFSREYTTSITTIETAERSTAVDTLATKRDIGVMVEVTRASLGSLAVGVFNGEGQNASANRDSSVLVVGRAVLRAIPFVTLGASGATYESDSTRYGIEGSFEDGGVLLRAEMIGQHRPHFGRDDRGWYALAGWRARPWLQPIAKVEDFQREGRGPAYRMSAVTLGANVELPGGRTRLLVNFVSQKTGAARVRRDAVIAQGQVRF